MVADEPVAGLETVPLITSASADYKKFLPWGPFYGVWVKKDVPDAAKSALVGAYRKVLQEPKAQEFITNFGSIPMGISGAEADKFLTHWQIITDLASPGRGGDQGLSREVRNSQAVGRV